MQFTDSDLPDAAKLQDIVTYDVVPELESYLLEISKTLHGSLDATEDHMRNQKSGGDSEESKEDEDSREEEKEEEDESQERGRPRKREDRKATQRPAEAEDKGDIYERVQAVYELAKQGEKELDEVNELKSKYKIGIQVYDGYIQKLLEQIGREFLQGTLASYE